MDLLMEKVICQIGYESNDNPKCRIIIGNIKVHEFVGATGKGEEQFEFEVSPGPFNFKIEHYGKNMKTDVSKYIEIKTLHFNYVDLKNKIWETTQVADVPGWQNTSDFKWQGNLYLGHNGYIEYSMCSPVINFLLEYHTKGAKTSSNMESYDMELLYEMKDYFSKIVKEQDGKH